MELYTIDYRDGRTVTGEFENLDQAKAAAENGMFYTGLPVWILNEAGERVAAADFVKADPNETNDPYTRIAENEKGIGYYKEWQDIREK